MNKNTGTFALRFLRLLIGILVWDDNVLGWCVADVLPTIGNQTPGLVISSISANPASGMPGDSISVAVTVKNNGENNQNTTPFVVNLAPDGTDYPGALWQGAATPNFEVANRLFSDVRWIVIHTTECTTAAAVQRFQNPAEKVSAHYIVSRDGSIVQLAHNKDIAYGAGNYPYNQTCINLEHERYGASDWTEAQFQASAALVKWLATQYDIQIVFPSDIAPANPLSGTGVIGHNQVPDPANPALGGGANHHPDPVNWDWAYYRSLFSGPEIRIGIARLDGQQFQVSLATAPATNYTLEFKNSLADPNWTTAQTLPGTGGTITLTDSAATNLTRFYRVRAQ